MFISIFPSQQNQLFSWILCVQIVRHNGNGPLEIHHSELTLQSRDKTVEKSGSASF